MHHAAIHSHPCILRHAAVADTPAAEAAADNVREVADCTRVAPGEVACNWVVEVEAEEPGTRRPGQEKHHIPAEPEEAPSHCFPVSCSSFGAGKQLVGCIGAGVVVAVVADISEPSRRVTLSHLGPAQCPRYWDSLHAARLTPA
jgi:hypothetical protein